MVEQLAEWRIFDPIENPLKYVYDDIYKELSADIHVVPDRTNIGRRLLAEKELFETEVIPDEINKYTETLHKVMDIGIVAELNILEDLTNMNEKVRKWLNEWLFVITDLELNSASRKIAKMVK